MPTKTGSTGGPSARGLTIGIDARALQLQRTGVERMLYNLVANLPAVSQGHRILLFVDGEHLEERFTQPPFEMVRIAVRWPRLQGLFDFWLAFQIAREIKRRGVDVFYAAHTKFPFTRRPCFVTVHGLEWYFYPDGYRFVERLKQWLWFQLSCRFSAGVITFAQHTRSDIAKIKPVLGRPLCVVPEAAEERFRSLEPGEVDPSVLEKFHIDGPFALSVCSLEPRKNIDGLIRAFAKVVATVDLPHRLVLVGRSAWKSEALHDLVDRSGIRDRVRFTGYVEDEELIQLYNQADLFLYPSKYEGFGLPVLEAMACGVPVLTSRSSSLPEVAGDAAILVDAFSVDSLAEGMQRGLTDACLSADLVARGRERAAGFSWQATAAGIFRFITQGGAP